MRGKGCVIPQVFREQKWEDQWSPHNNNTLYEGSHQVRRKMQAFISESKVSPHMRYSICRGNSSDLIFQ